MATRRSSDCWGFSDARVTTGYLLTRGISEDIAYQAAGEFIRVEEARGEEGDWEYPHVFHAVVDDPLVVGIDLPCPYVEITRQNMVEAHASNARLAYMLATRSCLLCGYKKEGHLHA